MNSPGTFWIAAIAIGTIAHEAGHFIAARRLGLRVARFTVGGIFPVAHWRDHNGTNYVIGLLPIGGHVEIPDLLDASRRVQLWVFAAGPLANLLVAACWLPFEPSGAIANAALAGLNLLPIPVLDGGRIVAALSGGSIAMRPASPSVSPPPPRASSERVSAAEPPAAP